MNLVVCMRYADVLCLVSCSLFQEVYPDLLKAAKQGKGSAVKLAAVDALSLCCFVAAEDEYTTLEVMEKLQGLWNKGEYMTNRDLVLPKHVTAYVVDY